mmetsp:Transcript_3735/g.15274  ORF Transcript_3735/g.15274 Transcript_3735/m.15274 type:complete len:204 (+) Transcript_3735:124-735(+)
MQRDALGRRLNLARHRLRPPQQRLPDAPSPERARDDHPGQVEEVTVRREVEKSGHVRHERLPRTLGSTRGEEREVARSDERRAVLAVIRHEAQKITAAPPHLLHEPVEEVPARAAALVEASREQVCNLPQLVEKLLAVTVHLPDPPLRRALVPALLDGLERSQLRPCRRGSAFPVWRRRGSDPSTSDASTHARHASKIVFERH